LSPIFVGKNSVAYRHLACHNMSESFIVVRNAVNWVMYRLASNTALSLAAQTRARTLFAPGANAFGAMARVLWPDGLGPTAGGEVVAATRSSVTLGVHARHHFPAGGGRNPYGHTRSTDGRSGSSGNSTSHTARRTIADGSGNEPVDFHRRLFACARVALHSHREQGPNGGMPQRGSCVVYLAVEQAPMLLALLTLAHTELPGCVLLSSLNATTLEWPLQISTTASAGRRARRKHTDWGDLGMSSRHLSTDLRALQSATTMVGTYSSTFSELVAAHANRPLLLVHATQSTSDALMHATWSIRGKRRRGMLLTECIDAQQQYPKPTFETKRAVEACNATSP